MQLIRPSYNLTLTFPYDSNKRKCKMKRLTMRLVDFYLKTNAMQAKSSRVHGPLFFMSIAKKWCLLLGILYTILLQHVAKYYFLCMGNGFWFCYNTKVVEQSREGRLFFSSELQLHFAFAPLLAKHIFNNTHFQLKTENWEAMRLREMRFFCSLGYYGKRARGEEET